MDSTVDIGLERLQRAVTLLMYQNINTAIAAQNTLWDARDATFYAAMGRQDPSITVESISPDQMYPGTIPSLIEAPMENYPNLCVIAYAGRPQNANDDWGEFYAVNLTVEIMVKSQRSEEECNARIQRTLEAAHSVLTSDKNRRIPEGSAGENLVPQIPRGPVATIGNVFVKHVDRDANLRWFYQGGSLTYIIDKYAKY